MIKLYHLMFILLPTVLLATPNTPASLTFHNLTQTSVTLQWQDKSNDERGFKVYRNGELISIVSPNIQTFTDRYLTKSTRYTYTVKATDDRDLKNILFAHGYQSDKETWDTFAQYTRNVGGYHIFRFDVPKDKSIRERATVLAQHINNNADKIADASLLCVGHSMGGLDLRYIVSLGHENAQDKNDIFYKAAKKIAKIYTLATPHKGTSLAGIDDATKDMTDENMKIFNERYPYVTYKIGERKIPFLAYRFKCGDAKTSGGNDPQVADSDDIDGVVFTQKQLFNDAPYTQSIFSGKHTEDVLCLQGSDEELEQTEILQDILDDNAESMDIKDIVFYEENSCQSDEAGVFSSRYKVAGVRCLDSDECDNNKISSLMLFPSLKKQTTIELYSNNSETTSDDWVRISIGDKSLSKPLCIGSFEHGLSNEAKEKGITMEYHQVDFGEDGLDAKVSYVKVY